MSYIERWPYVFNSCPVVQMAHMSINQGRGSYINNPLIELSEDDLKWCIIQLHYQKENLLKEISKLQAIAPKRYKIADGKIAVYHCPEDLIPIEDISNGTQ
jgi:hypothetical protein